MSVWFYHYVKIKTNRKEERKAGRREGRKERSHETGYRGKKNQKERFSRTLPVSLVTLKKEDDG